MPPRGQTTLGPQCRALENKPPSMYMRLEENCCKLTRPQRGLGGEGQAAQASADNRLARCRDCEVGRAATAVHAILRASNVRAPCTVATPRLVLTDADKGAELSEASDVTRK